jgi:hypothetical protein
MVYLNFKKKGLELLDHKKGRVVLIVRAYKKMRRRVAPIDHQDQAYSKASLKFLLNKGLKIRYFISLGY